MADRPTSPVPSVQILCPHLTCRKVLSVPIDVRGQLVKCQHCQNVLRVPAGRPAAKDKAA